MLQQYKHHDNEKHFQKLMAMNIIGLLAYLWHRKHKFVYNFQQCMATVYVMSVLCRAPNDAVHQIILALSLFTMKDYFCSLSFCLFLRQLLPENMTEKSVLTSTDSNVHRWQACVSVVFSHPSISFLSLKTLHIQCIHCLLLMWLISYVVSHARNYRNGLKLS